MGRWQPNARGRLELAALELYHERGFDQSTVAEIAGRAGLTERTFFRHFSDKRDVLFGGSEVLQELMVAAVAAAPATVTPFVAAGCGVVAAAEAISQRGQEFASRRSEIIAASPELRERELIKLEALADALAATLRERGVGEPIASLAAHGAMAAFRVAFDRWAGGAEGDDFPALMSESLDQLSAVSLDR